MDTTKAAHTPGLIEALRIIADTPCDHGPGFCPRKIASEAIAKAEGTTP